MDFLELERRVLNHLRHRVRSGELTERRLAHSPASRDIHDVLSDKGFLSLETANVILHLLHIERLDLLDPEERLPPPGS